MSLTTKGKIDIGIFEEYNNPTILGYNDLTLNKVGELFSMKQTTHGDPLMISEEPLSLAI